MALQLLKCIAKAVARHGGQFLAEVIPGADALCEMAVDAYQDYCQRCEESALRAEVQALALATAEQVRQEVQVAVQAEGGRLPADLQQKMAAYLTQVPAMIRRSLRRPTDPSGTTIPPNLALKRPEDLLPFLPARPPRFKPGDRPLPGVDWVLEEPLGVGGFGEVWKARHAHLTSKEPVALKFCLDPSAVPVLRNEAGILDQVMRHGRHAGIVPLLQTYLSADPPCLEYEFVQGGDLAAFIQELHQRGKAITATANRVLLRLAEIVAFAHRAAPPIVHGDLKPANVLVGRGAKGELSFRVTDFGIGGLAASRAAREVRQPTRSRPQLLTEVVRGAYTPLYASAEQMARRRGEAADPRDDVHALGVIWYQLVTGDLGMLTVPTDWREELEQHGLAEPLVKLLAACIAPKAERRPASAVVLAGQLAPLLQAPSGVIPAPEPPSLNQPAEVVPKPLPKPVPVATPVLPPPTGSASGVRQPPRAAGAIPVGTQERAAAGPLIGPGVITIPGAIPVGTQERAAEEGDKKKKSAIPVEALERAAEAVFAPAVWLLNVGGLLCLAVPILLVAVPATGASRYWGAGEVLLFLLGGVVVLALGIVILRAGLHLLKLQSYRVALIGSIVTIYVGVLTLPFVGAGLLILPGGIKATRVLRRKDVKAAFATRGEERDLSPAEAEKRQRAAEAVFAPAVWLLNVGGLLCLAVPILLVAVPATGASRYWGAGEVLLFLLGGVVVLALGIVILRAGLHLLKLQSYRVALIGSIVTIYVGVLTLPFVGAGLLILPGGIKATRVLRRQEVKSAFGG